MNSGIVLMAWQALSKQMDSFLILSRYVAQQCSKPVSLLGDQKGLRMIKVGGLHHSWLSLEKGHCMKHNLLFYFQLSSWSEVLDLQVGVEWFLRRTGAAATAHLEVFFLQSRTFFYLFRRRAGSSEAEREWSILTYNSTFSHHRFHFWSSSLLSLARGLYSSLFPYKGAPPIKKKVFFRALPKLPNWSLIIDHWSGDRPRQSGSPPWSFPVPRWTNASH